MSLLLSRIAPPAITGTGAIVFAVAALSASAAQTITGTASVAISAPSLASVGVETFTGTAAAAFTGPALDATAVQTLAASGEVSFAAPSLAGNGAETFTGEATASFAVPSISGSGALEIAGVGAESFAAPVIAGAGLETFAATGAVVIAAPAIIGGEPPVVAGESWAPGSWEWWSEGAWGSAEVAESTIDIGSPSLDGAGTITVAQAPPIISSGVWLPRRQVSRAGIHGTGEFSVRGPRIRGAGHLAIDGQVTLAVAPPDAMGRGAVEFVGAGDSPVIGPDVEAHGSVIPPAIRGVGGVMAGAPAMAGGGVVFPVAADAIDRAWSHLQARAQIEDEDDLVLLGVFDR